MLYSMRGTCKHAMETSSMPKLDPLSFIPPAKSIRQRLQVVEETELRIQQRETELAEEKRKLQVLLRTAEEIESQHRREVPRG